MIESLVSQGMQLHKGVVTRVYPSGLIDVRSLSDDRFFERINVVHPFGSDTDIDVNTNVVFLSDGSQHFVLGRIREPRIDEAGKTTVRELQNDLADLSGSAALISTDDVGNQSKVVAARGGGVILDAGGFCVTHMDPGKLSIRSYSERSRHVSVPLYIDADHDGSRCTAKMKFRSQVDAESIDRDLADLPNDSEDNGKTVVLELSDDSNVIDLKVRKNGVETSSLVIDEDGSITIDADSVLNVEMGGDVSISSGRNIDVQSSRSTSISSGSSVEIDAGTKAEMKGSLNSVFRAQNGQVYIGNDAVSLLGIINQLLIQLQASTVVTIFGPQPVNPIVGGAPVLQAQLALIKGT